MRIKFVAATLLAASTLIPVVNAADGTIEFQGTIRDTACTVDAGSATQVVQIGNVSKSAFTGAGSTAGGESFKITLTACDPTITRVAARFDGPSADGDSRLLKISDPAVTGVGIGIFESDNTTLIPIASKSASVPVTTATGAELEFVAKFMSTATAVTGGIGNATATFSMDYN